MYTLTLVFNQDKTKVLMCDHKKLHNLNYIGGKIEKNESPMEASYRELFEETGISKEDIELSYIRYENVKLNNLIGIEDYEMYITAGVLLHDIELTPEKNELIWVSIYDINLLLNSYGNGNNYMFMKESLMVLNTLDKKGRV